MVDPKERLAAGAEILGAKLYPLGFGFQFGLEGKGSGGHFAVVSFSKGDRELRLWFRWELGGVFYRKGDVECTHAQFMQAIGRENSSSYPGFGHGDDLAG